ncbi:hypothetical protein Tco_0610671 [Tanacetum coccineum]
MKVFNNMKRPTKGYSGQEVALFPIMIDVTAPSTSPSRITSLPSHSPEHSSHSPEHSPSPTPSPSLEPTPAHTTTDGQEIRSRVKIRKARKQARVVLSDEEDITDDSSKQGRKLSDVEVQEKASNETEPVIQDVTPTEVIQDQEGSEKGSDEVRIAGGTVTYTRRSAEKRSRQDKLEEQMNEEQRAQIARDAEIARQWDEEERKRAMDEVKSTKKIDWNDPSVIRYHTLKMKPKTVTQARKNMIKYLKNQGNYKISDFKGMSYNEIRPIFEKV